MATNHRARPASLRSSRAGPAQEKVKSMRTLTASALIALSIVAIRPARAEDKQPKAHDPHATTVTPAPTEVPLTEITSLNITTYTGEGGVEIGPLDNLKVATFKPLSRVR